MEFTCTYCEKVITCMAVIIDSTHIFHKVCEKEYNAKIKLFEERKQELNEFIYKE